MMPLRGFRWPGGGPKVKIQPDGESLTAERKGDPQLTVEGKKVVLWRPILTG